MAAIAEQGFLFDAHARPEGQLLKWVGNKFRYAELITSHFPREYRTYYEPFIGTGAVLATMRPHAAVAGDTLSTLIQFHRLVQTEPERLIVHYAAARADLMTRGDTAYREIRDRYNAAPNPEDLLVLSRACYGGVVRFTRDGTMSTPLGPHRPMAADKLARYMVDWQSRLQSTSFICQPFEKTLRLAAAGDIIYCDPPYKHGQRILYGAQDFRLSALWDEIEGAVSRGAWVAVSIDGFRRSGEKAIELGVPSGLFRRELLVRRGGCMLRRFQLGGADMSEEQVADRLLLSW